MHTRNRHWRRRTRFPKDVMHPFLEVKPRLHQLMVRYRARGQRCWLDKGVSLLGPGLRLEKGALLKLPFGERVPFLRQRHPKPKKPPYPLKVTQSGQFRRLLKAPVRRREF